MTALRIGFHLDACCTKCSAGEPYTLSVWYLYMCAVTTLFDNMDEDEIKSM